ncbi:hypothetical protein ACS0TY_013899 [Phlomoides rotata]
MATGGYGGGSAAGVIGTPKKKQRIGINSCLSFTQPIIDLSDGTQTETPRKELYRFDYPAFSAAYRFKDPATADVIFNIRVDGETPSFDSLDVVSDVISMKQLETQKIYLHSCAFRRSKYFVSLLSDRWQRQSDWLSSNEAENYPKISRINHVIPANGDSMDNFISVLKLLYSDNLLFSIDNLSTALDLLPIALELLFEDCVKACIRFIEAVTWSEDDENRILSLIL